MAEEGVTVSVVNPVNQVIGIHSVESWNEHIQKGKDSNKLIVVDFTATWCGPCRFIAPILDQIAKETPQAIFLKVDVDEMKSLAEEWTVEAMPSFLLLKDGKEVDRVVGANKDGLLKAISTHAAVAAA